MWLLVFAAEALTILLGNAERMKMLKSMQQNVFLKNSTEDSSYNKQFEVQKKAPHGTRWKFLGVTADDAWPKSGEVLWAFHLK